MISGGDSSSGFAPSFIEKPRIIPNESGTLITLRCNCTANPKPEVKWYKGTKLVTETSKISMKVTGQENTYEILLLIQVIIMFFNWYNTINVKIIRLGKIIIIIFNYRTQLVRTVAHIDVT